MASKILVDELAPQSHATDVTLATGKKIAGANTQFKITGGVNTNVLTTDGSGGLTWGGAGNSVKRACLVDEKADTVAGGTFTASAWQQRDMQTEYYDTIGITFGTNTFILPAGTFYFDWSCPADHVHSHQTRLYNITSAAVVKYGSSEYAQLSSAHTQSRSTGSATVTLGVTATFKIEHRAQVTRATSGFGFPCSFGNVEVYTIVNIMQIA